MDYNIGNTLVAVPGMRLSCKVEDYPDGIIIPVNKPYRWTSADVIRKLKYSAIRHFGKKNLKVGHAGTLDPLASGVLLVCIGKATRLAEALQASDKEYRALVCLGATTPSYDLEKAPDRFLPYRHITGESVTKALSAFVGEQDQVAPLFSAKSVDGVRAYETARKLFRENAGNTDGIIDEKARELIRTSRIVIHKAELLSFSTDGRTLVRSHDEGLCKYGRINVEDCSGLDLPAAEILIGCSKGTYIRAIARDLGEALGSGGFLLDLERTRSGQFKIEDSLSVDEAVALFCSQENNI